MRNIFQNNLESKEFEQFNIIFVPFVNIDGYIHINEHWHQDDWENAKLKRKNLNKETPCKDIE